MGVAGARLSVPEAWHPTKPPSGWGKHTVKPLLEACSFPRACLIKKGYEGFLSLLKIDLSKTLFLLDDHDTFLRSIQAHI